MLFALPDPDILYAALLARDASYDGRAIVGVTSTGIFCRLTCPAPKPKRANCRFFETAAEALDEGFRPCKRCHPLGDEPLVTQLLAALRAAPDHRWTEADLVARGLDPSTIRRLFRRRTGRTFLEIARQQRLARGLGEIGAGARVIDAQQAAGFESGSGFRAAMARMLGCPPAALRRDAPLKAAWIDTPLGEMIAVTSDNALHLLEFADRPALPTELARLRRGTGAIGLGETAATTRIRGELDAYFGGRAARFDTPLAQPGTPFQRAVWDALRTIPAGRTTSYGDLARNIGRPTATRAVARANGANTIAIVVPCHRVIGADGTLTGYGGGLWRKDRLIALERSYRSDP